MAWAQCESVLSPLSYLLRHRQRLIAATLSVVCALSTAPTYADLPQQALKASGQAMARSTVGGLQALVVTLILTSAQVVREQMEQELDIEPQTLIRRIRHTVTTVANEPTVWAGAIANMSANALAVEPIVGILSFFPEQMRKHTLLREAMLTGVGAALTTAGWEIFAEILRRARLQLSAEDQQRAAKVSNLLAALIPSSRPSLPGEDHYENARAARALFAACFKLLVNDPELREQAISTASRKKLITAPLVAEIVGISLLTGLSVKLFGMQSPWWAFGFGLAGGLAAALTPASVSTAINDSITWAYRRWLGHDLQRCHQDLEKRALQRRYTLPADNEVDWLATILDHCQNTRNRLLSMEFENLSRNWRLQTTARQQLKQAEEAGRQQGQAEWLGQIKMAQYRVDETGRFVQEFYRQEREQMETLSMRSSEPNVRFSLHCEAYQMQAAQEFAQALVMGLENEKSTLLDKLDQQGYYERDYWRRPDPHEIEYRCDAPGLRPYREVP